VAQVSDYTAKLKILKEAMDQLMAQCKARIWIIIIVIIIIIIPDFSIVLPVVLSLLYKY
jgi:uncharacterized SAM-binding protein YcdF (DUF218 family)